MSTSGRQADRCHLKLRKLGARGPKIVDAEGMACAVRSFTSDHRAALGPWIRVQRIDAVREKVSEASDFFDWFEELMDSLWISRLNVCPPVGNHRALQDVVLKSSSVQVLSNPVFEETPANQHLSNLVREIV